MTLGRGNDVPVSMLSNTVEPTHKCPSCNGEGGSLCHHNTGADSSKHFWAKFKCTLCKGAGWVTTKTIANVKAGKRLQSDMHKQGKTLSQVATAFGVSVPEMSSVYRGRKSLGDAIEDARASRKCQAGIKVKGERHER